MLPCIARNPHALNQGCGSATCFRDYRTKKKIKNLFSPGHVSARRSRRYIIQRNTKFMLRQLYEILVHSPDSNMESCLLPLQFLSFLLYSVEPNLPLCAAACPALRDINGHATAWKFHCPLSPCSVFPRQSIYWETNVRASRIVLNLKSVIWHHSATRFRDLQGEIKIDEFTRADGSGTLTVKLGLSSRGPIRVEMAAAAGVLYAHPAAQTQQSSRAPASCAPARRPLACQRRTAAAAAPWLGLGTLELPSPHLSTWSWQVTN